MSVMNIGNAASWRASRDNGRHVFRTRDPLNVAAAILDGASLSAVLWVAIVLLVR
jgi:hypothetical protein